MNELNSKNIINSIYKKFIFNPLFYERVKYEEYYTYESNENENEFFEHIVRDLCDEFRESSFIISKHEFNVYKVICDISCYDLYDDLN